MASGAAVDSPPVDILQAAGDNEEFFIQGAAANALDFYGVDEDQDEEKWGRNGHPRKWLQSSANGNRI